MSFIKENFVAFLTRLALGFFLSLALGGIFYVVAWIIVISFWAITPNTILVMATSGIGVGAGVGGALGWIDLDSPKSQFLFLVIVGILGAIAGAWGGLYYGRTVYIMGGMPGIPELSGIFKGAALGGSLLPLLVGVIRGVRAGEL